MFHNVGCGGWWGVVGAEDQHEDHVSSHQIFPDHLHHEHHEHHHRSDHYHSLMMLASWRSRTHWDWTRLCSVTAGRMVLSSSEPGSTTHLPTHQHNLCNIPSLPHPLHPPSPFYLKIIIITIKSFLFIPKNKYEQPKIYSFFHHLTFLHFYNIFHFLMA